MSRAGKKLLEQEPRSLNRPLITGKCGGVTYVVIPVPPHPLAATCPKCRVRPGQPCAHMSQLGEPFSKRAETWTKHPHRERTSWAKKMHVLSTLKKLEPCRAAYLGSVLWGNGYRKPQSYARAAGKVLNQLEKEGRVRQSMDDWGTNWETTNWS